MKPREVIRIRKTVSKAGAWKLVTGHGGRMPATAFLLARRRPIVLPRGYHWRVDDLDANGIPLQLLTAFNPRIEQFRSWLAWPLERMLVVIARFEFHGTHPGWHCHSACCDIASLDPAQPLSRQLDRFPTATARHRRVDFGTRFGAMTEASALSIAFKFYRISGTPEGMLL